MTARWIAALGGLAAIAPTWGQTFQNEPLARGVDYSVQTLGIFGSGLLLADFDQDDDPDLLLIGAVRGPAVYENQGNGTFIERSTLPMASGAVGLLSSLSAADYDGDGDVDVYCAVFEGANFLLRNEGNFTFSDVSASAGVNDSGFGMGSAWGDYNGDGWLDLYVANRTGSTLTGGGVDTVPNRLYRNNGDGTFTDVAASEGVQAGLAPTLQPCFVDLDRDGDVELYLANDKGANANCGSWRNQLWENDGGVYTDISSVSGTDVCLDAMSVTLGDADLDGRIDMYSTNTPPGNALMLQQSDLVFTESAATYGVAVYRLGWGAVLFDYDLDQDHDLYVCNANWFNMLFTAGSSLPWTENGMTLGLYDPSESYCVAMADIDLDGDVDLIQSNDGSRVRVYINDAATGNSMQLRIRGTYPNLHAVGATVRVTTPEAVQARAVVAGSAFKSQHELLQTFGLGTNIQADEMEVTWPGGEVRVLRDYPIGRWEIVPDALLGDFNRDGQINWRDGRRLKACLGASSFEPDCACFDFDGDADVDTADAIEFQARRGLSPAPLPATGFDITRP